MKITIYTISDCYFSKQEKEYLASHQLPFEERNLEENREWLTEMLTISNNFAGTPVTKVEKDDGNIVVLKGFTKDEFDQTFGFDSAQTDTASTPAPVAETPVVPPPPPVVEPTPVAPTPSPVVTPPPIETPAPSTQTPAQPDLSSIAAQIEQLKKLQESLAQQSVTVAPAPVSVTEAPVVPPVTIQPAPAPVPEASVTPPTPIPVAQAPTPQTPAANVDDSLAAILAELQSKINSSTPTGGTGTAPPATS